MDRKEAQIAGLELFSACRPKDLRWVASTADMIYLPPGTVMASEGATVREFVVIVEGEASIGCDGGPPRPLSAGDYFGHDGLIDRLPHTATVEASTPVRALVFEARAFHGLLDKMPSVGRKLMRDLVTELRTVDRRVFAGVLAPRLETAS